MGQISEGIFKKLQSETVVFCMSVGEVMVFLRLFGGRQPYTAAVKEDRGLRGGREEACCARFPSEVSACNHCQPCIFVALIKSRL